MRNVSPRVENLVKVSPKQKPKNKFQEHRKVLSAAQWQRVKIAYTGCAGAANSRKYNVLHNTVTQAKNAHLATRKAMRGTTRRATCRATRKSNGERKTAAQHAVTRRRAAKTKRPAEQQRVARHSNAKQPTATLAIRKATRSIAR